MASGPDKKRRGRDDAIHYATTPIKRSVNWVLSLQKPAMEAWRDTECNSGLGRTGNSRAKSTNQGGRADARTRRGHQQPAKRGISTIYRQYEEIRSLEKENEDGKVARMTMDQRGWRSAGERKERR